MEEKGVGWSIESKGQKKREREREQGRKVRRKSVQQGKSICGPQSILRGYPL